ncbi:protein-disulfide reductase DsbD family protein [Sinimarinibacterium thermocellulolyticum]|uniref:Protein-disulfide reductase DsbD domain-containing protein n=1 Tax=Sinimarinibacterium thermocellulolyticum TaxID=3170016 RepID=A0ABV2ADE2_9GAMM
MSSRPHPIPYLSVLLLATLAGNVAAAPVRTAEVEAELHAQTLALQHGDNLVGLRLRPEPGWHVYWRNPGDSGIPTKLEWTLPAGIDAGELQWPYPHPESLGELTNYGYAEETLHPVTIHVDDAVTDETVTLRARASWLACKDICVPGAADLELTLPLGDAPAQPNRDWSHLFDKALRELPQAAGDWPARFATDGRDVSLAVESPALEGARRVAFFAYANDLVNHAAPQRVALEGARLRLSQTISPYFVDAPARVEGVLVVEHEEGTRAYEISAAPGVVAVVAPTATMPALEPRRSSIGTGSGAPPPTLALVLLFALVGGLILNLMPCVFPVLSLKALSLVKAHGDDGGERRRQTYAYSAGVIASCVLVAAAMLVLRSAGEAVGWGFQLQSPAFVALMTYVLFALGLSLSGAVNFGVGLMNLGSGLTQQPGLVGAFFTGVLAVVVASPCTAPFMGTALGYAMTQPAWIALLVFATLGLGLALPFLLLGWFPALARYLPKPGAWMERFKQLMAFPLYLSVVWLLWVLVRQTDAQALARVLLGLVAIAFALWLWASRGVVASTLKLAALAGAFALALMPAQGGGSAPTPSAAYEPWSSERVAELRADGRTIFVDFTADWCLSCKVNERVALKSAKVQRAFAEHNVALLVGDWTRADPLITAELARFGRNGVPLYLVYVDGGEPVVLPQLLTPEIVLASLSAADGIDRDRPVAKRKDGD